MSDAWLAVAVGIGCVGALILAAALVLDIKKTTKGTQAGLQKQPTSGHTVWQRFWGNAA